jgi:hypothetical protein
MKERFDLDNDAKYDHQYDSWKKWNDGRERAPWMICDGWKKDV